jgi:hypothetical protein
MANPILVGISGVPSTVAVGTSVTATASVSDGTANVVYVWYLNGVSQATGPSYSFGSNLNTGYYRLDVTAFTADGIRAGSATASFQIAKESNAWIIGFWVLDRPYAPYTDSTDFNANGTASHYMDGSLEGTFTWSLNGDVLSFSDGTAHFDFTITKVSNDEFIFDLGHFYRKVPGDSIFAKAETALSEGGWTEGTITEGGMKLYSFTAPSAGSYQISWEDSQNGGAYTGYTGSIGVAAYKSDQVTPFFLNESRPPQTVSLGEGEKMLVIVSGRADGTFRIMVRPVGTAPEFTGTWTVTLTSPIVATITTTLTSTTLHTFLDAGASGTTTLDGNVSGVDETLKHFIVTYTTVTNTGGFVAYEHPSDFEYFLYALSGNTLTMDNNTINVATFPTAFSSSAFTFTKVP